MSSPIQNFGINLINLFNNIGQECSIISGWGFNAWQGFLGDCIGCCVATTDEVNEILSEIGVTPEVKELKRLGEFKRDRKKPRTLLVTVANEHEARLALAKSIEHREELAKRNIYLLPALSKEDALKENLILKKIRELLTEGVPLEKLKIGNLELFNDGAKVEIASLETKSN